MKLDRVTREQLVRVAPGGYEQKGDTVTWVFENFKPSRDVEVVFRLTR